MTKKAIAVLSAGIKKNKIGEWVSTGLDEEDFGLGAPGGSIRIAAAVYMYKKNPSLKIITSGERGWDIQNDEPGRPNLSAILKRELIDLGVDKQSILEENRSNKTFEQLVELDKLITKLKLDYLTIVTNHYHLKRVKAMLLALDIKNIKKIKVESAEKICLSNDRGRWQHTIGIAYSSELMKKVIDSEEKGIKDLVNGNYKFK